MPKPEVCGRCSEEIRYGVRSGMLAWWHREHVDHIPMHGRPVSAADLAEIERQHTQVVRYYDDGTAYTTAEHDIMRDKDVDRRRCRLAALHGEDPDYIEPLPPIEVYAHDVDPADFAPRSGIKQVVNLIPKQGWELRAVKHARGPYIGSDGSCLSISDTHVVKARGPVEVDGSTPFVVASWRDGKFDFAYIGIFKNGRLSPTKVDATTMKNWIKGNRDLPDTLQEPGE